MCGAALARLRIRRAPGPALARHQYRSARAWSQRCTTRCRFAPSRRSDVGRRRCARRRRSRQRDRVGILARRLVGMQPGQPLSRPSGPHCRRRLRDERPRRGGRPACWSHSRASCGAAIGRRYGRHSMSPTAAYQQMIETSNDPLAVAAAIEALCAYAVHRSASISCPATYYVGSETRSCRTCVQTRSRSERHVDVIAGQGAHRNFFSRRAGVRRHHAPTALRH